MATTTTINLPKRQRPIRDSIGAIASTIGTTANVVQLGATIIEDQLSELKADMALDNFEAETERLVRRAQLETQRAQLLGK